MLSLLVFALNLSPAQLQPADEVPALYCTSSMDDKGRSSGVICEPLPEPGSIDPQASPECGDICPRGNSGQPEEPIGQQ